MPHHKTCSLVLHEYNIEIKSDNRRFISVVCSSLPYYFEREVQKSISNKKKILISFNKTNKIPRNNHVSAAYIAKYDIPSVGIWRTIDYDKNQILIRAKDYVNSGGNWIFHVAFLSPLSFLLRKFSSSLVHAALVERNGSGILIMGAKGAGKSTFSTVCLQNGFRYYSDEHPLLEIKGDKIKGKSFFSHIGLPAVSRRNFKELNTHMSWSTKRRKYYLDPQAVQPGSLGNVCEIKKIIFPKFSLGHKLTLKKLTTSQSLNLFLLDEYFHFDCQNETTKKLSLWHFEMAAKLVGSTSGFSLNYGTGSIRKIPELLKRL